MILLFTRKNAASSNIADSLIPKLHSSGKKEWTLSKTKDKLIETDSPSVLEVPTNFETDCIIVLSSHKSKVKEKVFTVHVPGNWNSADMGGIPKTLNACPVKAFKIFSQEVKKAADGIGWNFSLEADHHGPSCSVPILFVEMGTEEPEWTDKKAGNAIADGILRSLERCSLEDESYSAALCFGGGHFSKPLTKMQTEGDLAISHICPKYTIDSIDENLFAQAVEKSTKKPDKVIILEDEVNARQREKIITFAKKFSLDILLI